MLEGWLRKRGVSGVLHTWRRRYIVLTPERIAWHRSDDKPLQPAGWLSFDGAARPHARAVPQQPLHLEVIVGDARLVLETQSTAQVAHAAPTLGSHTPPLAPHLSRRSPHTCRRQ